MPRLTITEALAELKTLDKRILVKQGSIPNYLVRDDRVRDPLAKDGGSAQWIASERQSITDLYTRKVELRVAIARVNDTTSVTVGTRTRTIAEWMQWRREVAPGYGAFIRGIAGTIKQINANVRQQEIQAAQKGAGMEPTQLVVNVDEAALLREIEEHEALLETLDGKLSLVNATTFVTLGAEEYVPVAPPASYARGFDDDVPL